METLYEKVTVLLILTHKKDEVLMRFESSAE